MSDALPRAVDPARSEQDAVEASLRPQTLAEFVGQPQLRDNLRVFIEAAKGRGEALDHVLLSGPPGLGKTTLAQIVAREMGVGFRATSGPVIQRGGDLAALLTNLQPRDILFIDEIHRLSPSVEEILYPASASVYPCGSPSTRRPISSPSWGAPLGCSLSICAPTAPPRSLAGRAAPRASRCACCGGSATLPRSRVWRA